MKAELINSAGQTYISIQYWEDKGILYTNWTGSYIPAQDVKAGAMLMLEMIKKYQVTLLLNDNREVIGVWDEVNEWIATQWTPTAVAAGLQKFAHILSIDLYAQLSAEFMEDNVKKIENAFEIKLFDKQEDAEKWLLA